MAAFSSCVDINHLTRLHPETKEMKVVIVVRAVAIR